MKTNYLIIALIATTIFGTSCKKGCTDSTASNFDEAAKKDDGSCVYAEDTTTNAAAQPGNYTPSFDGTFATLVGIKSISTTSTPIGNVDTEIGTAVAVFSEDGGSTFLDAGSVTLNSESLSKQSNNSYVFTPSTSQPSGISLGGTLYWEATGNSWPAFTGSTSQDFATVSTISSSDIASGSSYTLTCGGVTSADSVYFGIYGPDGNEYFIAPAGTNSHTFSASEVNAIGTGQGYIQVVGLKYDLQSISGRDYWFINETVRTNSVTID